MRLTLDEPSAKAAEGGALPPVGGPLGPTTPQTGGAEVEEAELPVTVIEKRSSWRIGFRELWRYRELLVTLTWRDIVVRYKQTVLGALWAVLQPLATMVVFTVFFGKVAGATSEGVPYPLFAFAGLLAWFFFSNAVTSASQSIVGNQALVTKVYFPRLIIPLSAVGTNLVDLVVGFALLLVMLPFYGFTPGWGALLVPPLALLLFVAALGVGTLLSALTVAYRDFRYVVPFTVQLWMFATPSVYMQADVVGPRGRAWLPLNPAYGLVANFRAAALGRELDLYSLAVSGAVALALLAVGCLYFRRVERSFADMI